MSHDEYDKHRDPEAESRRKRIFGGIPVAGSPEDRLRDEMNRLSEQIKADKPKQSA